MTKKIILIFFIFSFVTLLGCSNNSNVESVINNINNIPAIEDITIEDEEFIIEVNNLYNKLSKNEQSKINNYDILISANNQIELLKQEKLKIDEIIKLIDELPSEDNLVLSDENKLNYITNLLNELSNNQINQINNYEKYLEIKYLINNLKEDQMKKEQADNIINLINNLPSILDLSIDDKELIISIREQYDTCPDDVKESITNFGKFLEIEKLISIIEKCNNTNPYDILKCISDVATSNTNDLLFEEEGKYEIRWKSSNPNLYYFENGFGKVSKVYQTHKAQTITVGFEYYVNNEYVFEISKEIVVDPVLFDDMNETPVATYFQTSALSSYKGYSDRYKKEKSIFSNKAKEALDIIYYAFAHLDEKGNITLSDENVVPELIQMKEYNVRNVLCLAGVSALTSKYFTEVTGDPVLRKNFVKNIMDYVEKYNFDGVDVDWESTGDYNVIAKNMNDLIRDLREEMDKRQDPNGSPYLLTIAVPASSEGSDVSRFDYKTLNQYVDFYNIMSYALNDTTKATHLTPLYTSSFDNGYKASADFAAKLIVSRGAESKKIIIGAGAYGKLYIVTGIQTNSKYPGLGATAKITSISSIPNSYTSGTLFLNAIKALIDTGKFVKYFEYNENEQLVGSYLYNEEDKLFITYDSEELISAKYHYAKSNGYGLMCWAYTQDTYDAFVNTIFDELNK